MNNFYVRDGRQVKYFNNVPEVVSFLELVVKEKTKMNRAEWMQHNVDLGHGADEASGKNFTESLVDLVEVGVIKNGRHVRCSIHEATAFTKPEYGD